MFDSLDEQMKHHDAIGTTKTERVFKWAAVAVVSILFFAGLYLAIQMME